MSGRVGGVGALLMGRGPVEYPERREGGTLPNWRYLVDDRGQGSELTEASLSWDRACCDRTNLPAGSLGPSRFLVSSAIHSTHSAGSCDNCPVEGQMVCVLTTMNWQRRPFSLPYMLLPPLFLLVLCPLLLQGP